MWRIAGIMTSLLIFCMRAAGMTNDMVFTLWHIIRHDFILLTWILNLIIQFIIRLYTELAIVKVSHRIRDCVFWARLYTGTRGVCIFLLPEGQRPQLDTVQFPPNVSSGIPCVSTHVSIQNPRWPVKQELQLLLVWFPVAQKYRNTKLITICLGPWGC